MPAATNYFSQRELSAFAKAVVGNHFITENFLSTLTPDQLHTILVEDFGVSSASANQLHQSDSADFACVTTLAIMLVQRFGE
jgi:hypothetical protein